MAYRDEVLADSPALYWRLGEPSGSNANDETANNRDGTYGSGVTKGVVGALVRDPDTAVTLDNTGNGKVTSSYDPFVDGTGRTFEGWAYRASEAADDGLFNSTGSPAAFLRADTASGIARFSPTAAAGGVTWPAGTIPLAQWFHWVLTFDESTDTAELFINGVSKGTRTHASAWGVGNFEVGNFDPWNGSMDEIAVYESILSPARIAAHYAAGKPYSGEVMADSPLLYWRLSELSGTTAFDGTANSRNGVYGGGFTLGAAGALAGDAGTAVDLDGADGRVTSTYNPFTNGSQRSYEAWVWRDVNTNYHTIFSGTVTPCLICRLDSGVDSILFQPDHSVGGVTWANVGVETGAWRHVVVTFDEATNTAELFVNGVSKGQQTVTAAYAASPGNLVVGARVVSEPFNGKLDEVAVYPSILSPARIAAHYAAGAPAITPSRRTLTGVGS